MLLKTKILWTLILTRTLAAAVFGAATACTAMSVSLSNAPTCCALGPVTVAVTGCGTCHSSCDRVWDLSQ